MAKVPSSSSTSLSFAVLLTVHMLAAIYCPIQDCDETFNFWEPSHYLNHGYGLQTWEFSPIYAIRSWLYASLHSLFISILSTVTFSSSKTLQFFGLRCALAFINAVCETVLFAAISRTMNVRIGVIFVIICASSAGMFHASVAYLPSSFAMYAVALAMADFMDRSSGDNTGRGFAWLAFGTIVGWPFVAVLAAPFVVAELVSCVISGRFASSVQTLIHGLVPSLFILAIETAVDTGFYRKLTSVPFNIVQYNVLSKSGKGPDIYGVEPWHFYIRNLLINFNFWFLLALLSFPVLVTLAMSPTLVRPKSITRTVTLLSPFYLWFAIFTAQPHKEERFMYPVYPCLAFNAATALHVILVNVSNFSSPKTILGRIPASVKLFFSVAVVSVFALLGIWRIAGIVSAYSAPLSIYRSLHDHPSISANPNAEFNVCVGKEWYRFPSSYHIPSNSRLKFIKSEFRGLLPGEFAETFSSSGLFPATWMIPSGMNDENIEDPGKYTNLEHCHFLVDSSFPGHESSRLEPDFADDEKSWEKVKCLRFLDSSKSSLVARLFWIPDSGFVPTRFRRQWGQYCLLSRKSPPP